VQIAVETKYIQLLIVFVFVGGAARNLDDRVHFVGRSGTDWE
jgi:hypothetical protein